MPVQSQSNTYLECCRIVVRRNETMMARKDRTVAERPKAIATAASVDMAIEVE